MTQLKMIFQVSLALSFLSAAHGLQCYVCESIMGNECDDTADKPGELQDCPADRQNGCFISEVGIGHSGKSTVTRGCTALDNEDAYKCEVHTVGTNAFTFCNCHGEKCNKDWEFAAGPGIKCYNCNSANEGEAGKCDETNAGALAECPIEKRKGCYISKATYGKDTVFERGCTEVTDPTEYVCKNIGNNGQGLHYCNCHGDECNKNFGNSGAESAFISTAAIIGVLSVLLL